MKKLILNRFAGDIYETLSINSLNIDILISINIGKNKELIVTLYLLLISSFKIPLLFGIISKISIAIAPFDKTAADCQYQHTNHLHKCVLHAASSHLELISCKTFH